MDTGWQLLAESINSGRALRADAAGLDGVIVNGPARQVMAVLFESRLEGRDFESAWKKARRSLLAPRTSTTTLSARVQEDLDALQEIRPQIQAAYEARDPTVDELAEAAELVDRRLADVAV